MQQRRLDQTLALAGLFHATWLVCRIAREQPVDERQIAMALRPVFELDPPSVQAVYGDACSRNILLALLKTQLGGTERDAEVTRHAATLMHLERKLVRRDDLMRKLRAGIESARTQLEHFGPTHENLTGRLGDLYAETISTLRPRVIVQGRGTALADSANANRVRALLLAGMRSVVLWRQSGGNRIKLVFGRQQLVAAANELAPDRESTDQ